MKIYEAKKKAMNKNLDDDASTERKKKKSTKRKNNIKDLVVLVQIIKGMLKKSLPMRITMMIMGSPAAPFSIVIAPDETISDLKAKVEFREGFIPSKKQTLFHRQKRLDDDKMITVRKAKFKGGDTIHCFTRRIIDV